MPSWRSDFAPPASAVPSSHNRLKNYWYNHRCPWSKKQQQLIFIRVTDIFQYVVKKRVGLDILNESIQIEWYGMTDLDQLVTWLFIVRQPVTPLTIESHRTIIFAEHHRMLWKYFFLSNIVECYGKEFYFQNMLRLPRLR